MLKSKSQDDTGMENYAAIMERKFNKFHVMASVVDSSTNVTLFLLPLSQHTLHVPTVASIFTMKKERYIKIIPLCSLPESANKYEQAEQH